MTVIITLLKIVLGRNPITNGIKANINTIYFKNFIWRKTLLTTWLTFKPYRKMLFRVWFRQTASVGLCKSIFDLNVDLFSPLDLAVAIKIDIVDFGMDSKIQDEKIYQISKHICYQLSEGVQKDKATHDWLKRSQKDISPLKHKTPFKLMMETLSSVALRSRHFYMQMEDVEGKAELTIFHANEDGWVANSVEDSIKIRVNPYQIRTGTFQHNFDYRLIIDGQVVDLVVATRVNGNEYFNPNNVESWHGVVWVR